MGASALILIDTHIWVWWTSDPDKLSARSREVLSTTTEPIGLSSISCWEVSKLIEYGRLDLDRPVLEWIRSSITSKQIFLLGLTPEIAVASTQLPPGFHRDPADQIIVATAIVHGAHLLTEDEKMLQYPHVRLA